MSFLYSFMPLSFTLLTKWRISLLFIYVRGIYLTGKQFHPESYCQWLSVTLVLHSDKNDTNKKSLRKCALFELCRPQHSNLHKYYRTNNKYKMCEPKRRMQSLVAFCIADIQIEQFIWFVCERGRAMFCLYLIVSVHSSHRLKWSIVFMHNALHLLLLSICETM